jgi:hypothetical protein
MIPLKGEGLGVRVDSVSISDVQTPPNSGVPVPKRTSPRRFSGSLRATP